MMKNKFASLPICFISAIILPLILAGSSAAERPHYVLHWADEFDGEQGSAPDSSKWIYDIGASGWGNNELESYTDRRDNSALDGKGHLQINAKRETFTGSDGVKREYTSARLLTKGKFAQRYGRFEARIRLPYGQGLWPAFWMMGDNISTVQWPKCGEIDVMENVGKEPGINHGSLHGPGYSGNDSLTGDFALRHGKKLSDAFHVYAIEWKPNEIRFLVDGQSYCTRTPKDIGNKEWVYNRPFFILLNVAIGGDWPGNPDETTRFPQTMLVDYVRVYEDANLADHD